MPKQVIAHLVRLRGPGIIMPSPSTHRHGDTGTEILATIYDGNEDRDTDPEPTNLSNATVTILLCGAGGVVEKTAEILDAAAGEVRITTVADDLVAGPLAIRARVAWPDRGIVSHTGAVRMQVERVCR